ncbi:MAG: chemotaxis protein CheW [Paracoccaceae bacterium]
MSESAANAAAPAGAGTDTGGTGGEVAQYVTFAVGDRSFGVDIMSVCEIRQWTPATPLPHQPAWNRGVLNLRGAIVPVHDLRARLGDELTEPTPSHVVVIVSIRGQSVGILVDTVSDILTVRAGQVRPLPSNVAEVDNSTINGLVSEGGTMVALLDLNRLFPSAA